MVIVGIGTDIVQIPRIEKILINYKRLFKEKILNILELDILNKLPAEKHAGFLAKRFAAKESISKALGFGIGSYISFKDISILNDAKGKPYVKIENSINANQYKIDITLSDDYPIAIAFAVVSI